MTLSETNEAISHHAIRQEDEAANAMERGDHEGAARCNARAKCAHAGKLLHGDEEQRDANYAMTHQHLVTGAYKHNLVVTTPLADARAAVRDEKNRF